ncbi:T9SS type A sorting domain-containing protein [Hymenobacter terricola]|uniref:T9SS type A sorting domain-containing protein n=1 Tax=Hymenobacter terricola TaxID=2819236 RepID=UPI001B31338D|nr:T9SS type A sorting domain-containing protein [Hymenobacter terricola]
MKRFYSFLLPALTCLALLLGRPAPVAAQFLWQRAVGTATRDETAEFMVPVAGGFVTLGKFHPSGQQFGEGLYLSKVNYAGDTVWTKRWVLNQADILYPRGLIEDRSGNLVATVITSNPLANPTRQPVSRGRLVKFTPTGDTLWTRTVQAASNAALDVLVLGNDGNYVAIGNLAATLPALFKYSPTGALLWTQLVPYNNSILGYLQNLVAVPGGYLLFASSNTNIRGKYISVDEVGFYRFERLASFYGPVRLQLDTQGNVLAIGGGLTKLTVQGDSLWTHSYQQYGVLLSLSRLVELPNGRYLAAGTRANGPTHDVGLVVVDRNGTRLRDTLFVRGGDENVAGVALTPTGNYVVALGSAPGPIGGTDQILFAYRNWDRLLPTRTAQSAGLAQLAAYPNPTADELTLMAADAHLLAGHWVLYDLLGRAVQTGTLPGLASCRLSLAGQPAGLYLLQVTDPRRNTIQTLRVEKN